MSALDDRVAELARRDLPLAVDLLRQVIGVPADHVDRPIDAGGDPSCGRSNHEGPRLELLRRAVVELDAVRSPADVGVDGFGNLVWTVDDPDDGVAPGDRAVVFLDGHTDTVDALRSAWPARLGPGIDAYAGLTDPDRIDRSALRTEVGHLPPDDQWQHLVFGRGAADQLGGVVAQVLATRILLELQAEGSLRGVVVRSHLTVAEEDNDGGGPRWVTANLLPRHPELVPDVVILTEGTGDAAKGALGIYRGQRGRMQIEVAITGRSAHGSMPWEGLNPLEHGGAVLAEAARRADVEGFAVDPFLGPGSRTASWAALDTPSDCAVPDRFVVRFDRRLTAGESPEKALAEVEGLDAVAEARAAGLAVEVAVPRYTAPTWSGHEPGDPQIYPGWVTPADHPAITVAEEVYRRVVSPHLPAGAAGTSGGTLRVEPRVDRWIFSTDGVGFPVPDDGRLDVPATKGWVTAANGYRHPPMLGFGPGIEQNTHKVGECVDTRELGLAIAFLARYPSLFADRRGRPAPGLG